MKIKLENIFPLSELPESSSTAESLSPSSEVHPEAVCPFLGREVWVNHSGSLAPCCAPDLQRKALGDFGNVKDGGVSRMWKSESYRSLERNYLRDHQMCRSCNLRKPPTRALTTSIPIPIPIPTTPTPLSAQAKAEAEAASVQHK